MSGAKRKRITLVCGLVVFGLLIGGIYYLMSLPDVVVFTQQERTTEAQALAKSSNEWQIVGYTEKRSIVGGRISGIADQTTILCKSGKYYTFPRSESSFLKSLIDQSKFPEIGGKPFSEDMLQEIPASNDDQAIQYVRTVLEKTDS